MRPPNRRTWQKLNDLGSSAFVLSRQSIIEVNRTAKTAPVGRHSSAKLLHRIGVFFFPPRIYFFFVTPSSSSARCTDPTATPPPPARPPRTKPPARRPTRTAPPPPPTIPYPLLPDLPRSFSNFRESFPPRPTPPAWRFGTIPIPRARTTPPVSSVPIPRGIDRWDPWIGTAGRCFPIYGRCLVPVISSADRTLAPRIPCTPNRTRRSARVSNLPNRPRRIGP
mmetsp:Transcript_21146/g.42650  ORF Transcript_21146/g.42650 Transcript_21146/m.42650 type:complete len:223 (-) Transcript_21146:514-1182(-)